MNNISQIQTPFIQNQSVPKVDAESKGHVSAVATRVARGGVQAAQNESEKMTSQLVTGEVQDIHEVMIASQKASISLQLTVQVRNKVVEAYQEVMRMQL